MLQTKVDPIEEADAWSSESRLVSEAVSLVRFHASRLSVQLSIGSTVEEIINAGVLGLIEAGRTFDPGAGSDFKTYADSKIREAIVQRLRELNTASYPIHSSKPQQSSPQTKVESHTESKDLELCRELRINLDQLSSSVFNAQLNGFTIGSFSYCSKRDDHWGEKRRFIGYRVERDSECSCVLEETEMVRIVAAGVDDLPAQERLVVSLHEHEELTIKEIAKILRMPQWKILQLHTKAMMRLRTRLISHCESHELPKMGGM